MFSIRAIKGLQTDPRVHLLPVVQLHIKLFGSRGNLQAEAQTGNANEQHDHAGDANDQGRR